MSDTTRPSGPAKTVRPFTPDLNEHDPAKRAAHALEHIATVLSALDHNLEVMTIEAVRYMRQGGRPAGGGGGGGGGGAGQRGGRPGGRPGGPGRPAADEG